MSEGKTPMIEKYTTITTKIITITILRIVFQEILYFNSSSMSFSLTSSIIFGTHFILSYLGSL